jgi:hypothetical protein
MREQDVGAAWSVRQVEPGGQRRTLRADEHGALGLHPVFLTYG